MPASRARVLALLQTLRARADVAPPDDWLPVDLGDVEVGVTSPEIGSFLATAEPACTLLDYRLRIEDHGDHATRTALLNAIAERLREGGYLRGWRHEQLDVRPVTGGPALATIERAACRALAIATHAVHMNAFDSRSRLVVARRAENKAIDPGLWDNLVGGMVASGEDEITALARETKEEAGLDLDLLTLTRGGLLSERRPVAEGYMVETVQVFDTNLPPGTEPRNEDGEVAAFAARSVADVLQAIERGEFTLEAGLVTVDALLRRL